MTDDTPLDLHNLPDHSQAHPTGIANCSSVTQVLCLSPQTLIFMEQLLPYVETVGSMLVTLQGNDSTDKSLIWLLLLMIR